MQTLKQIIHNAVDDALKRNMYNQVKAAKELKISRNTLRKYMSPGLTKTNLKKQNILHGNFEL